MSYKNFENEDQNRPKEKFIFQRWLYGLFGCLTMAPIVTLTLAQLNNLPRENNQFGVYFLLFFVSILVLTSIFFTAITGRASNGFFTIVQLIWLFSYTSLHFYTGFLIGETHPKNESIFIALRLGFVATIFVVLLPWTSLLTRMYRKNATEQEESPRMEVFSWSIEIHFVSMLSIFLVKIRNRNEFNRDQLVFFCVALSYVVLWLTIGKLLRNKSWQNWFSWMIFYSLSIGQVLYIGNVLCQNFSDFNKVSDLINVDWLPSVMVTFACVGSSFLSHLLTMTISLSLIFCK